MIHKVDPNDSPGGRVSIIRKELGLKVDDFAKGIGKSRSLFSLIESGKSELLLDTAMALQTKYGVSWQWLMAGEGSMWVPKSHVVQLGEHTEFIERPFIEGAASCGLTGNIEDPPQNAMRQVIRRQLAHEALNRSGGGRLMDLYFLRCEGDSMSPTIQDSDIALVNTAFQARTSPKNNGIYLVRKSPQNQEGRVKRVLLDKEHHRLHLASDNRAYASIVLDLDDVQLQQLVLGRVCWVERFLLGSDPPETDW